MPRKKRASAKRAKQGKPAVALRERVHLSWKNLILFAILFILSFLLYSLSSDALLENFFAVLSIIFGFLAFAFLIVFIVLSVLKAGRK
jgi:hypothetical protein